MSHVLLWQPSDCVHSMLMIVLCCSRKINKYYADDYDLFTEILWVTEILVEVTMTVEFSYLYCFLSAIALTGFVIVAMAIQAVPATDQSVTVALDAAGDESIEEVDSCTISRKYVISSPSSWTIRQKLRVTLQMCRCAIYTVVHKKRDTFSFSITLANVDGFS